MRRDLLLAAALLFSGLGALAPGCSQPSPTQLIVVVDTDYVIPGEIDEIDVDVLGPDGVHHRERQPMASRSALPYTLAVLPTGSALGPVRIDAIGLHSGTPVITRTARVSLVAQQSLMITLYLLHACDPAHVTCATDQTCADDGHCHAIDVAPLPWTGTAPRIGTDAGALPDAGARDTGVDAPRGPDASVDANLPDAFGTDASTDCHVVGCPDDGNPCTDEVCGMTGACTHPNNASGCDDGLFCNGTDLCGGGSCSIHSGDPCGGAACDESGRRCGSCVHDTDCPAPLMGAFGACGGFADACTPNGTHSRTIQTFHCTGGSCMPTPTTDTQACMRASQDGLSCGGTTCGSYGSCTSTTTMCALTGTQSRACTDMICSGGTCGGVPRTEMASCTRTGVDGTSCMATSCTAWAGTCDYTGDCHATGQVQTRSCTDYACAGGSCAASMPRTEMQPCPIAAAGTVCTDTTIHCGVFRCNSAGTCAQSTGGCTGGRICCNPPICSFPATC